MIRRNERVLSAFAFRVSQEPACSTFCSISLNTANTTTEFGNNEKNIFDTETVAL